MSTQPPKTVDLSNRLGDLVKVYTSVATMTFEGIVYDSELIVTRSGRLYAVEPSDLVEEVLPKVNNFRTKVMITVVDSKKKKHYRALRLIDFYYAGVGNRYYITDEPALDRVKLIDIQPLTGLGKILFGG